MVNIVIVAGGLGTRFKELSIFPKILLPTLNNSSILSEDIEEFKNNKIYLVINEKFYDQIINYISVNNLTEKIQVIKSTNTNGSFNSINEIKEFLPNENLLFVWSDLILKNTNSLIDICEKSDNGIIFTNSGKYRYNVSNIQNSIKIEEVKDYNGNVPGIYFLKNKLIFDRIKNENTFDLIDAIKEDLVNFNYSSYEFNNIVEYRDLQIYINYMSKNIEFNEFQTRFFNKILIDKSKNIILKEAIDENYYHLIQKEIMWYKAYFRNTLNNFVVPKLIDHEITSMKLEYLNGFEQLHKVLTDFENSNEYDKIKKIYQNIKIAVDNLGDTLTKEIPFDQFKQDLFTQVVEKVLQRCDKISKFLLNYNKENLKQILTKVYDYILNDVKNSNDYNKENNKIKYYFCHGDLNGSNTLVNPKTLEIKFVDPRGYFGKTIMYGWKEYEYSKLLYCLYGYDNFNLLPCVYKYVGLPKIRKCFENKISKPSYLDKKIYKLLVGVIYVALAGYISQDIMKANQAYDFGLEILKKELVNE